MAWWLLPGDGESGKASRLCEGNRRAAGLYDKHAEEKNRQQQQQQQQLKEAAQ